MNIRLPHSHPILDLAFVFAPLILSPQISFQQLQDLQHLRTFVQSAAYLGLEPQVSPLPSRGVKGVQFLLR